MNSSDKLDDRGVRLKRNVEQFTPPMMIPATVRHDQPAFQDPAERGHNSARIPQTQLRTSHRYYPTGGHKTRYAKQEGLNPSKGVKEEFSLRFTFPP